MLKDPTGKESVYSTILDDPNLPAPEKAALRLEQEGALLVLAGAESPAKTLNIIFYHLFANTSILKASQRAGSSARVCILDSA